MTPFDTPDLLWWVSAVELPVLAGLFWLVMRVRRDDEQAMTDLRRRTEQAMARLRDRLADHRIEVARSYVSIPHLKDIENRLTDHLLRIEAKLGSGPGPAGGQASS